MSSALIWQITAAISLPLLIAGLVMIVRAMRRLTAAARARCSRCGYDRSATPDSACPECGFAADKQRRRRIRLIVQGFSLGALLIVAAEWNASRAVRAERHGWTEFVPTTGWLVVALRPDAHVALRNLRERTQAGEAWWWQRDAMRRIALRKLVNPGAVDRDDAMAVLVQLFRLQPRPLDAHERAVLVTFLRIEPVGRAKSSALDLLEAHGDLVENTALLKEIAGFIVPVANPAGGKYLPLRALFERQRADDGAFPDLAEIVLDTLAHAGQARLNCLALLREFPEAVNPTLALVDRLHELVDPADPETAMLALQALSALKVPIDVHAEQIERVIDQALAAGDPQLNSVAWLVARCPVDGELRWRVVEHLLSQPSPRTAWAAWICGGQQEWTAANMTRLRALIERIWGSQTGPGAIAPADLVKALERVEALQARGAAQAGQ